MATRNVSIRLATVNGKKVKKTLSDVGNTGQKAMNRITRASKPASRGLLVVDRASNAAARGVKSVAMQASAFVAAYAGIQGLAHTITILSSFDQAMANVKAVTSASAEEMKALKASAREMGATTIFSASEAASGLEFLGRAGFDVAKSIAALPATLHLAAAGGVELGLAADITSNVMSGFAIAADNAAVVADVLAMTTASANTNVEQLGEAMSYVAPVARAMHQSIEATAAGIGVLSDSGIQASSAGTGLRRVLSELASPSAAAAATLKKLRIELHEVDPAAVSLISIIERLKNANLSAADAFKIFGERGAPAILALTSNVDKLKSLTTELESAKGAAKSMSDVMQNNLAGDFKALNSAFEEMMHKSGDAGVTGALRGATQAGTDFLRVAAGMESAVKGNVVVYESLVNVIAITAKGFGALLVARTVAKGFSLLTASMMSQKGAYVGMQMMASVSKLTAARFAVTTLAANTLRASLALIGGPVGLAVLAGATIWQLSESQESAADAAERHAIQLDELAKSATTADTALSSMNNNLRESTKLSIVAQRREVEGNIKNITSDLKYGSIGGFWDQFQRNGTKTQADLRAVKEAFQTDKISLDEFEGYISKIGIRDESFTKQAQDLVEKIRSLKKEQETLIKLKEAEKRLDTGQAAFEKKNIIEKVANEEALLEKKTVNQQKIFDSMKRNVDEEYDLHLNYEEKRKKLLEEEKQALEEIAKLRGGMDKSDIDRLVAKTKELYRRKAEEISKPKKSKTKSVFEEIEEARKKDLESSRKWEDGVKRSLEEYASAATNSAKKAESAVSRAFSSMEDAIVGFATTGKMSFSDFANSIISDMVKIFVQSQITGVLANAMAGYFSPSSSASSGKAVPLQGNTSYKIAHTGGIIGGDSLATRSVNPAVFAGAPKFHTGGIVGDEVPIIARRGEGVFTPKQMAAMGGKSDVNVTIINETGTNAQAEVNRQQDSRGVEKLVVRLFCDDNRKNGQMTRSIGNVFGLNRQGA